MPGRRNYSHENRKLLEGRRLPRLSEMPYASMYLGKPDAVALADALRVVNETIGRASLAVSKSAVDNFTSGTVLAQIFRLQEVIEDAAGSFGGLEADLASLWSDFKGELAAVSAEAWTASAAVQEELMAQVSSLTTDLERGRSFTEAAKTAIAEAAYPRANAVLVAVCALELVGFLAFLVREKCRRPLKVE
jgi:hypothetical protein